MQKSTQIWLIGCGSGCLLIVMAIAGVVASGVFMVQGMVKGFEAVIESRDELEERFGTADRFVPWADGAIPAERMAAFLAVREAGAEVRRAVAESFAALPTSEERLRKIADEPSLEEAGTFIDTIKAILGLGSSIGELFENRNRALLANGMGLGEYTYIYVLSYYVTGDHSSAEAAEGMPMPNTAARRIHDDMRQMLRHQLETLPETAPEEWRSRLQAELALLEEDPDRWPWEENPPPAIVASIEPYRESLEASFSRFTNPFELGRNESRGSWSFTVK